MHAAHSELPATAFDNILIFCYSDFQNMKTISIIRQRGQLTIPDAVRQQLSWAQPFSAVSVSVLTPNEIIIRPHKQQTDWDNLWRMIAQARKISGRGTGNLSQFIAEDREARR